MLDWFFVRLYNEDDARLDALLGRIVQYHGKYASKTCAKSRKWSLCGVALKDPAHKYTAPEGELLVAMDGDEVLGMVAYHRHSDVRCEMKRLYVRPKARGMHLGSILVKEIIMHARKAGYREKIGRAHV